MKSIILGIYDTYENFEVDKCIEIERKIFVLGKIFTEESKSIETAREYKL